MAGPLRSDGKARISRDAERVVALFHGHFHNGLRGLDDHASVHEIVLPSALYNRDREFEAEVGEGCNPVEFRPSYTLARIRNGAMELSMGLDYRITGTDAKVSKNLPVRCS